MGLCPILNLQGCKTVATISFALKTVATISFALKTVAAL